MVDAPVTCREMTAAVTPWSPEQSEEDRAFLWERFDAEVERMWGPLRLGILVHQMMAHLARVDGTRTDRPLQS